MVVYWHRYRYAAVRLARNMVIVQRGHTTHRPITGGADHGVTFWYECLRSHFTARALAIRREATCSSSFALMRGSGVALGKPSLHFRQPSHTAIQTKEHRRNPNGPTL